jgi:protein-disulfide isomerase
MNKLVATFIAGLALAFAMLVFGYVAGTGTARHQAVAAVAVGQQEAAPRGDLDAAIRGYLLDNPEILTEMQVVLDQRQREQERVAQQDVISGASDVIFNAAYDGVVGNPNGSVTIVEFFDYNCGFCKRALADMEALIAADPDLRFVLKEFPILGPDSQRAHMVSMAFHLLSPENYGDFHRDLMGLEGRANEDTAIAVAVSHGVDEGALRAEMENPAIIQAFRETYELADRLNITGTPSYVVGQEVVFGALGQAALAERIEVARN